MPAPNTPTIGDDIFVSEAGNNNLDGLAGSDILMYSGESSGYRIDNNGSGTVTITDIHLADGDDGIDTLTHVERITFANGVEAFTGLTQGGASIPLAPTNTGSGAYVDDVSSTALEDGGWLLTWEENHVEERTVYIPGYYDVYAMEYVPGHYGPELFDIHEVKQQQFAADGSAIGIATTLADFESDYGLDAMDVDTAALQGGGWVVAMRNGDEIVIQRYAADGTLVNQIEESQTFVGYPLDPQDTGIEVVALGDGDFMVSADSYSGSDAMVWQRFDADGIERVYAAYDYLGYGYGYGYGYQSGVGVEATAITTGGTTRIEVDAAGSTFIIGTYNESTGVFDETDRRYTYGYSNLPMSNPEITALTDGSSVVVWEETASTYYYGDQISIMMQRVDATGQFTGAVEMLGVQGGGVTSPDVVALADGGWVVVWVDGISLYQQRYSAEGVRTDIDPILVTSSLDGDFTVTALSTGEWVVAWTDNDGMLIQQQFSSGTTIYGTDNSYSVGDGNDHIVAGAGSQIIIGHSYAFSGYYGGNDTLEGGAGNDILIGGDGTNVLLAGTGNDILVSSGAGDLLNGGDGDDVYRVDVSGEGDLGITIQADSSGNDTLQLTGDNFPAVNSVIDLNPNTLSVVTFQNIDIWQGSLTIGAGVNIENVIATAGDDYVIGNSLNNMISTLSGNDTIESGAGNDKVIAGDGNDRIVDTAGNDVLSGGFGDDTFVVGGSTGSVTINDNLNRNTIDVSGAVSATVVDLTGDTISKAGGTRTLTINGEIWDVIGSSFADAITGNSLNNLLQGFGGNDTLVGAGDTGRDTLVGGLGDDRYIVDSDSADLVQEAVGAGVDTVEFHLMDNDESYVLNANVEKLVLVGNDTILGGRAIGNALNNTLAGTDGDNALDGGTGKDTMAGGKGNDIYYVDNIGDVVQETSTDSNEIETVKSVVTFTLGANLENLDLDGAANINATGNTLGNDIEGNSGNNILSGGAGNDTLVAAYGGIDTLVGGSGNDLYEVDEDDVINETSTVATEIDTVLISSTFTLGANLENLELQGGNLDATGNARNNILVGTAGDNVFNGLGGIDTVSYTHILWAGSSGIATSGVTANLAITTAQDTGAGFDTFINIENLTGSEYGDVLTGTATANVLDGGVGSDLLTGGAGDDTYVVDYSDSVVELADEGTDTVRSSDDHTLSDNVEHLVLIGTVALTGTGNSLNNRITGNDNDNVLDGATGNDTLMGGKGNDWYVVDVTTDVVTETTTVLTEIDTVESMVSYTLGANLEELVLAGIDNINATGNALNNVLYSNSGNNTLNGSTGLDTASYFYALNTVSVSLSTALVQDTGDGSDTLQGIENLEGSAYNDALVGSAIANVLDGGAGDDMMTGGAGNDTYVVDSGFDVVIETSTSASEIDTVKSSAVAYTLGANIENLVILEAAANADGTGNDKNNKLTGNSGANNLDGGLGNDTLIGGAGSDVYFVNVATDLIQETVTTASDIDTVYSEVSWALGANLEDLILNSAGNINGTGNALDNQIYGGSGNNTLNGLGGADTMTGYDGDDTYVVDNTGDVVSENSFEGNDTVQSAVSFDLADAGELENLVLTGTANTNGYGNDQDNEITGNAGANSLYGGWGDDTLNGGAGKDMMVGGAGYDTYIVDNIADVVIEVNEDYWQIDDVVSFVSWTLGDNVEDLTLIGAAVINGTGNELDNMLEGNTAANILNGGIGYDTLTGGAGADKFVIDTLSGDDLVTDFTKGLDKLVLDMSGLGGVGDGDAVVEGALVKATGSGGFSGSPVSGNELVIFQADIAGAIDATSAAAAIGSATSAMALNTTRLFVVDNGSESQVFLFTSSNADAVVDAGELKLLVTLDTVNTTGADYLFQA